MGFLTAFLVIGAGVSAACLWLWVEERLDERELARAARESAAARARRAAEIEADRAAQAAFQRQLGQVLGLADYFCRYSAHEQGLLRLDDYADLFPMLRRPVPPPADPAEPWQLNPKAGADE